MAGRQRGIVVPITATDNTERAFQSVQAQVAELRARVSSLQGQLAGGGNPGAALGAGFKHATPEIAAASGLVREFEGNLPIRAVERFLTTTLGLGPALSTIFPLVGAIAFAGVVVDSVEKLNEMRTAGKNAARDLAEAFSDFKSKLQTTNDELELTNSKLRDEIAVLEKHPNNGLQTALFEARVEADKLNQSLLADINQLQELLKQRAVGRIEGFVSGTATTTGADREVADDARVFRHQLAEEKKVYEEGLAAAGQNQAAREKQETDHFNRTAALNDQHAQHFRKRQAETNQQQKAADDAAAELRSRGLSAATPINLNALRDTFDDTASAYESLRDRTQLTGVNVSLKTTKDRLTGNKESGDAARKAEEEARKAREAQDKLAAAQRVLADATAREQASAEKAASEAQLAELERVHKALLLSDETFYQARLAVQNNALEAQRAAALGEKAAVQANIDNLLGQNLTGNDATAREAKVLELRAKLLELDGKIATVTGQEARNRAQSAESIEALTQKRVADADRQGAQLETTRGGGSTEARSKQLEDEYQRRRKELEAEFGTLNTPAVRDLDAQHTFDQDALQLRGAEESEAPGEAQRRAERQGIDAGQRRGSISSNEAQKERIALDQREAAALEPLLEAYQRLAADGDLGAIGKVAELKERIAELKDPVSDVAAEVRGQLDSAFEHVFENISQGKNALKEFGRALEGDVLKDLYKNAVQPGIQAGLGILIPNRQGQNLPQSPSLPQVGTAASGTRGTFGKLASSLFGGAGNSDKESGQQFKITIENKSSTPVQATSASGSFDSDAKTFVIHTILEDAVGGGLISHLFKG